jgi:hypothetical protein
MYYLDTIIFAKQMLPPNWRDARLTFAIVLLAPFKSILLDFAGFRSRAKLNVNLTAQTIVIEHYIKQMTHLNYGVYISQTTVVNEFKVNVPITGILYKNEIQIFLKKIIPAGRKYELIFY